MKERIEPNQDTVVGKQLEFLRKFIDSLKHAAYFVDISNYRISGTNAFARAIGYKDGAICYHRYKRNTPCDRSTGRSCPIPKLRKGGKVEAFHITEQTTKDGHKRVFEIHHYLVLDKNGKPAHLLVYTFEISERELMQKVFKETDKYYHALVQSQVVPSRFISKVNETPELRSPETELSELKLWTRIKGVESELIQTKIELEASKRAEQFKTELLSVVSHELRTPLASIKGFTSILRAADIQWSEDKRQNFLKEIDEETDRLNHLIGDLLDMSRLEAGLLKLEREPWNISDLIKSIKNKLDILSEKHKLKISIPKKLPIVIIDEIRIGQVVTNLVENATKFSPEGSNIILTAKADECSVTISVADNGCGINNEELDSIFNRFYSTGGLSGKQKKGLGLGLSICRGIIESHGGKIWVESEPQKGSKFSFNLPISQQNIELGNNE